MNAPQLTMDQGIVPLQPHLSRQFHYSERLVRWNPYSKKNQALCYQFQTGAEREPIQLIPDACIDFLFKCSETSPSAVISGVHTTPHSLVLEPNTVYFGFKPFSPKGMRKMESAWYELVDTTSTLEENFQETEWLAQVLTEQSTFDARIATISSFAQKRLADNGYSPDFIELSELHMCHAKGNLRMDAISDYTGYTGRYCREKFKEAHGISIKNYSSIIRFQNAVRMLSADDSPTLLADIVFDNGYFDQSHLNREFRRFAGEAPYRFRREILCG